MRCYYFHCTVIFKASIFATDIVIHHRKCPVLRIFPGEGCHHSPHASSMGTDAVKPDGRGSIFRMDSFGFSTISSSATAFSCTWPNSRQPTWIVLCVVEGINECFRLTDRVIVITAKYKYKFI